MLLDKFFKLNYDLKPTISLHYILLFTKLVQLLLVIHVRNQTSLHQYNKHTDGPFFEFWLQVFLPVWATTTSQLFRPQWGISVKHFFLKT